MSAVQSPKCTCKYPPSPKRTEIGMFKVTTRKKLVIVHNYDITTLKNNILCTRNVRSNIPSKWLPLTVPTPISLSLCSNVYTWPWFSCACLTLPFSEACDHLQQTNLKVGIKFLDKNCLIYQKKQRKVIGFIYLLGYSIWNPHTPCGRYAANLPRGECEFQMDKCLFCSSIWEPHSLCTTYWLNLPQIEGVEISCGCLKGANPFEINTTAVKCLQ